MQLEVNLLHIRGHVLVPAHHNKISPEFFISKTSLGTDICPPRSPVVACSVSDPIEFGFNWGSAQNVPQKSVEFYVLPCGMFRARDFPLASKTFMARGMKLLKYLTKYFHFNSKTFKF